MSPVSQLPRWPSSIYRIQMVGRSNVFSYVWWWWTHITYEQLSCKNTCTHNAFVKCDIFNIAATASPCLLYRLDGETALLYDRESICRCWVRRREGLSITFLPEGLWSFNIETSWFKCKYKNDHVLHVNAKFPSAYAVAVQLVRKKSHLNPLRLIAYFSNKLNELNLWATVTPLHLSLEYGYKKKEAFWGRTEAFPRDRLWSVVFLPLTVCQVFHFISLTV